MTGAASGLRGRRHLLKTYDERAVREKPALVIGADWIGPAERRSEPVVNPATEEELCRVPVATADDVAAAIAAAEAAFRAWRKTLPIDRSRILRRAAEIMRDRLEELAICITLEQGKPLAESRAEINMSADLFDWFAEEARRSYGRVIPGKVPGLSLTAVAEPIGPVAAFTAWNFPALVPARKVAGAVAAGCSIVVKASEETPITAVEIARALRDAGLPDGVVNVLYGDPDSISSALVASPQIRKITITGSTRVGKLLARRAADGMKPGTYELGGHSPVIVFGDVDVDKVVGLLAAAKFRNAGQVCTSPNRFFVHESVHDRFVARLATIASDLPVGNGLDEANLMGALTNQRRLDHVAELVEDAMDRGAHLRCGGMRIGNRGYFYAPTVLTDVPAEARLMAEEPFGPVVPIQRFSSVEDAVARANAVPFGLAAYVFSRSAETTREVSAELEAGMVGVNSCLVSHNEAPFGGVKESGYGREGAIEGLEAYQVKKLIAADLAA